MWHFSICLIQFSVVGVSCKLPEEYILSDCLSLPSYFLSISHLLQNSRDLILAWYIQAKSMAENQISFLRLSLRFQAISSTSMVYKNIRKPGKKIKKNQSICIYLLYIFKLLYFSEHSFSVEMEFYITKS